MKKYLLYILGLLLLSSVQLNAQSFIQVGTGEDHAEQPAYLAWNYSYCSVLYLASEMGGAKEITHIAFNNDVADLTQYNSDFTIKNQKVWFKHVSYADWTETKTGDYQYTYEDPENSDYTKVFEGDFYYGPLGWVIIELSEPFQYNGTDNLSMHWENSDGNSSRNPNFAITATEAPMVKCWGADGGVPKTPGYGFYPQARVNTRFYFTSDLPATPESIFPLNNQIKHNVDMVLKFKIGANTTGYDLYFGESEDDLSLVATDIVVTEEGEYTYTLTSRLKSLKDYYWRVIAKNDKGETNSPLYKFTTQELISDFPWFCGFEGKDTINIRTGGFYERTQWEFPFTGVNPFGIADELNAKSGEYGAKANTLSQGAYALKTPRMILPENQRISFWWRNGGMISESKSKYKTGDSTYFEVSKDGGNTWDRLDTFSSDENMQEFKNSYYDVSEYAGDNVYFRWVYQVFSSSGHYGFYFDDVEIKVNPSGAELHVGEDSLYFKELYVGGKTKLPIQLRNVGTKAVQIDSIVGDAGFYSEYKKQLEVDAIDTAFICFKPRESGKYEEVLNVYSEGNVLASFRSFGDALDVNATLFESFDVKREIPEHWNFIKSEWDLYSGVTIAHYKSDVYSAPYAAKIIALNDSVSPLLLITPGVSGYDKNKLSFMAKKADASYDLDLVVGYMDDPYDAESFIAVKSMALSADYEKYEVRFKPNVNKPYIAFKHGTEKPLTSLRIDDVAWDVTDIPPYDVLNVGPSADQEDVDVMKPVTLEWANGGGDPKYYKVFFGESEDAMEMVDSVSSNFTGFEIKEKLEFSKTYYWSVEAGNDFGKSIPNVWAFTTMDDPLVTEFPYVQDFESVTAVERQNDYPLGWSISDADADRVTWDAMANNSSFPGLTHNESNTSMHVAFNMINGKDDWLFSAPLKLDSTATYEVDFWIYTIMDMVTGLVYTEEIEVKMGGENNVDAMTDSITYAYVNDNKEWMNVNHTFSPDTNGAYFVGFHAISQPAQYVILFDDVTFRLVNSAPSFTSDPVKDLKLSFDYEYAITLTDAEANDISVELQEGPAWLSLTDNGDGTASLTGKATEAGSYEIMIKATDGTNAGYQKFTLEVSDDSNTSELSASKVMVGPNPVKDVLHIQLSESNENTEILIIDITGRTVYFEKVKSSKADVNVSDFHPGLYLVQILYKGEEYIERIIVK
jgi:hypothetical protein